MSYNADVPLTRRRLIEMSPLALLGACDAAPGSGVGPLLSGAQRFNDWVQARMFDPDKPAPEYADAELTPESGFRINGYKTEHPAIDANQWTLQVSGLVTRPGAYALAQVTALRKRVMNTRHCCVEGWSMIPKWGGAVLRDFLQLAGADLTAKYVSVRSADDYYTAYDMPSALHAQTLLCYEAYDKPLTVPHGAPLRVVMPVKLGYKSAKWVTALTVTNDKPGGYWEDQGYDWFAGI